MYNYYTYETYCGPKNVRLFAAKYRNNTLAVTVESYDEENKMWEPFATLTVNLAGVGYEEMQGKELAFVDTNNNTGVERFLKEYKIAKPTGFYGFSGFCSYPLYKFDLKKLEEIK